MKRRSVKQGIFEKNLLISYPFDTMTDSETQSYRSPTPGVTPNPLKIFPG